MAKGELGAALRALRKASGKEAKAVARSSVMSISKLSKIETGKQTPSVADVERILTAIGVSDEVKAEYLEQARAEKTEATAWRLIQRMGLHRAQEQVRALEAQMTRLKVLQPALIPGLLQTPEYIHAILSRHGLTEDVLSKTSRSRLERQRVLYDAGKDLQFIITESVFRWRIVSPARMAEQVDRIISLSRLSNIDIGVVSFAANQNDIANHAFVIRDERTVAVETVHAEIVVTDPRDVAEYVEKFERFSAVALHGDEMREMLEELRNELLQEQENG
ncbi:helix-turn-helix domain-containing protein [Streptomyces litchfieldiae]|uniref:Helix-turn-helix transcriptional regulator n=1 Tax=Streptomyces litchfieldiae TaxID=3075543 RepID=A0ABU2MJ31_9ACTN|nr:helix-turn-helix transcriptional regulator [Streptomyces sp. DSM 44938]MDT0341490.1 helix-turn-helix transcriptional regulator [Streptomyces sp. DSM 44938]